MHAVPQSLDNQDEYLDCLDVLLGDLVARSWVGRSGEAAGPRFAKRDINSYDSFFSLLPYSKYTLEKPCRKACIESMGGIGITERDGGHTVEQTIQHNRDRNI